MQLMCNITLQDDALDFAARVGYPCLLRPSFILSGSAMNVAYNPEELTRYLAQAAEVSQDHPVVITKFVIGAREIEMDAVAKDGIVSDELKGHFSGKGQCRVKGHCRGRGHCLVKGRCGARCHCRDSPEQ